MIADVGGTYTRLGILTAAGPAHVKVGENAASANLIVLLESYLQTVPASDHPTRGAIAVASPVTGDWVEMTNLNWRFSITDLKSRLKLDPLRVINDFMALALALPHLTADAVVQIGGGKAARGGAVAVVGPGTGLGVSGLLPCDGAHVPITGEGGHVSLAAHDEEEDRVLEWFRRRYGRVSAERVLSGQGLVDLYHCLCGGAPDPAISPEAVIALARLREDPFAVRTLETFFSFLGETAGDIALILGARGGVYLAGGILPRVPDMLASSPFRARFEDKGRFRRYMAEIPSFVITAPYPAFTGLQACLKQR